METSTKAPGCQQDGRSVADLLVSYQQAEIGGKAAGPLAQTALSLLARSIFLDLAGLEYVRREQVMALLGTEEATGFLVKLGGLDEACERIRSEAFKGKDARDGKVRATASTYVHAGRKLFNWGIAEGWPLLEEIEEAAEIEPADSPLPRLHKEAGEAQSRLRTTPYRLHFKDWPAELQKVYQKMETWFTATSAKGRAGREPVRPPTAKNWRMRVAMYLGYLTTMGVIPEDDLKDVQVFWDALNCYEWLQDFVNWYTDRQTKARKMEQYTPSTVHEVMTNIGTMVRHYYFPIILGREAKPGEVAALLVRADTKRPTPLKKKSERLPRIPDVILLAERIWKDAESAPNADQWAVKKRDALLLMMMMYFPMRRLNWMEARYGENVIREGDKRGNTLSWRVYFPGVQVKTNEDLECDLHSDLWDYLDAFVGEGRYKALYASQGKKSPRDTLLASKDRDWRAMKAGTLPERDLTIMFPAAGGQPMSEGTIYLAVSDWTYSGLPMRLSPHRMRDVTATTLLLWHPTDILTPAHMLGDSVDQVIRHYLHVTTKMSVARAGNIISAKTAEARKAAGERQAENGPRLDPALYMALAPRLSEDARKALVRYMPKTTELYLDRAIYDELAPDLDEDSRILLSSYLPPELEGPFTGKNGNGRAQKFG